MVSIIIVNYNVKKELIICVESIINSKPKVNFEIIVVDNDEKKNITESLRKKFPKVTYIPNINKGFGQGNNVGAKQAKGEYLFFLNPDTQVFPGTIDNLVFFLKKHINSAIVAPLLLGQDGKPYQQGALELTPLRAVFALSFLNNFFPNNSVSRKYYLFDWDRKSTKEVDVAPGTALIIKKDVFKKVHGFDENLFLYFEELDLCKRVKALGYKIFIYPKSRVFHAWGISTKQRVDIKNIFAKSRFYYFKKYYGVPLAFLTEKIISLSKTSLWALILLFLFLFLSTYKIAERMPFIGDQGWFYLSARDMLIEGKIPLVGIASSHPWLHQGPLWTYMLTAFFWIFKFNPVAPAYFTALLGVVTVFMMYKVGSEFFSKRVGLIAAAFFATSPFIIIHARTPYHTSPIPFFILLFIYSLYKWIKGNVIFFSLSILFLTILYNLELFTVVLWFIMFTILIFGALKKKMWLLKILNRKILFFSSLAFIIPMIPMLIYDFQNGFPQTLKFIIWIGYRVLRFLGLPSIHENVVSENLNLLIATSASYLKHLVFLPNEVIAVSIFILSFGFFLTKLYYNRRKGDLAYVVLGLTLIISLLGYFVNKTPSEAYIPIFFPLIFFLIALFFENLMKHRFLMIPSMLILVFILFFNAYSLISHDYLVEKGYSFTDRLNASKQIIKIANGREYNLIGRGEGSKFDSFTMNYEYLTWWLGSESSKEPQSLRFVINETSNGIIINKIEEKHND